MRRESAHVLLLALFCAVFATTPASGFIINTSNPDPWLSTASGPRSGNGAPATITWSIVPDGTSMSTGGGGTTTANLISFMNKNFRRHPGQLQFTLPPRVYLFYDSFGLWAQFGRAVSVYD